MVSYACLSLADTAPACMLVSLMLCWHACLIGGAPAGMPVERHCSGLPMLTTAGAGWQNMNCSQVGPWTGDGSQYHCVMGLISTEGAKTASIAQFGSDGVELLQSCC